MRIPLYIILIIGGALVAGFLTPHNSDSLPSPSHHKFSDLDISLDTPHGILSSISDNIEAADPEDDHNDDPLVPPPASQPLSGPAADAIWDKATCRGSLLLATFPLSESASSILLKWPYVQSPLDGTLYSELQKWGYFDDSVDSWAWDHSHCNFDVWHHLRRGFEDMKVDWRPALNGGSNLCFFVLHANGPGVQAIKVKGDDGNEEQEILPNPRDQRYNVDGRVYKITEAYSRIGINRKDGIVYFMNRRSPEAAAHKLWGIPQNDIKTSDLPEVRKSSDFAWGFWNRVPGDEIKHIKMIMVLGIVNKDTVDAIISRVLNILGQKEVQKWPGTDIVVGRKEHEEAAAALIGSPNGLSPAYFLLQHKRQLSNKFITKIKIFKADEDWEYDGPNLIFYVDDKPPIVTATGKDGTAKLVRRNGSEEGIVREHFLDRA